VYEVLTFEQHLQRAVEENATLPELRRAARRGGFAPMWQDGLNKCKLGLTTPAEVARVIAVHGEDALAGVDLAGVGPDGKAVEAGAPVRLSA
jgi:hypothetical protein